LAAAVTALTLWLIWLGYGYDLAYLGEFGLSPEQLGRGTSDFLLRSYRPLLAMAESLIKFDAWEAQQRILLRLAWSAAIVALFASSVLAFGAYAYSLRRRGSTTQERWVATRFAAFWSSNLLLAFRELVTPVLGPALALRSVWIDETTRWLVPTRLVGIAGGFAMSVAAFASMYALILACAILLGIAITAVSGWPLSATQAGVRSARDGVINPSKCAVPPSYEGPHCVRIVTKDCEVARGRLIDRSSQRIFLFVKARKTNVDLPLSGSVVEDVADEQPPAQGKPCSGN
jgi:hypothetical protein